MNPVGEVPAGGVAPEDAARVDAWHRFFAKYMRRQANEAALRWPERRSLEVDWFEVDRHNPVIAQHALEHPVESRAFAEQGIMLLDLPAFQTHEPRGAQPRLRVRLVNLPESARIEVRHLRAGHLGQAVSAYGVVRKMSEVRPRLVEGVFKCGRCSLLIREPQEDAQLTKEPVECYEDQGGCGKESKFKLITSEAAGVASVFVDSQRIEIQETPETMPPGEQPQRLLATFEDDLAGVGATPGKRVRLNGVLMPRPRKEGNGKSVVFDIVLETFSVEFDSRDTEQTNDAQEPLTEEERGMLIEWGVNGEEVVRAKRGDAFPDALRQRLIDVGVRAKLANKATWSDAPLLVFSRSPRLFKVMVDSICSDLFGLTEEKTAVLLQLFGGERKRTKTGTWLRGDIHILLVGDPATGKSQLLKFAANLAPRAIESGGRGSSGAGLTAAAVKDENDGGRWTVEAGAMVLASMGLLVADELDKMDKNDQAALLGALEQQVVQIAKAGIIATLQAQCSMLAGANPASGRFMPYEPLPEQIKMSPPLLSRFDCIFIMRDIPDAARDEFLSSHVLGNHQAAGAQKREEKEPGVFDPAELQRSVERLAGTVSVEFMRRYIVYAKRVCTPVLTDEARDKIRDHYVGERKAARVRADKEESAMVIPLTARQLEALVRLSEASARGRLSNDVTAEDAERAIKLHTASMRSSSNTKEGPLDADMVATGVSASQRESAHMVKVVIRELQTRATNGAALEEDVFTECGKRGLPRERVEAGLRALERTGETMAPRTGFVRLV